MDVVLRLLNHAGTDFADLLTDIQLRAADVEVNDDAAHTILTQINAAVDGVESQLTTLDASTQAVLTTLNTEDFASEATLAAFKTEAKSESDATQALLTSEFNETQTLLQTEFDATQTLLTTFKDEAKAESDASQVLITATNAAVLALQNSNEAHSDEVQALVTATNDTLALPLPVDAFDRIAKARGIVGEEVQFDDITAGDLYIGAAADGTATSTAGWNVVRYYRTAAGVVTRQRYRTAVVWDDRLTGWT